jgi:putative cardiolipin synthase
VRASLLLLIVLALVGCASHPRPEPSQALPAENSPLVQRIEQLAAGHAAGQSGYRLLPQSNEAFAARAEMIRAASRSLDIQYYILHDGLSTRALVVELLAAADRGVRIRLLLDDTASDRGDYRMRPWPPIQTSRSACSIRCTSAAAPV